MRSKVYWGNRSDPLGGFPRELWEACRPRWKQVHGTSIAEVKGFGQECGEVDGVWTRTPGQVIGVVTADCVPILLEHQPGSARAALHAGWRGVFSKIPESFFHALPPDLAAPSDWRVILGPSIRSCCYEVGTDLIDEFRRKFPEIDPGRLEPAPRKLDLVEVLKYQLESLGVRAVEVNPDCTYCGSDPDGAVYCSYRRGDRNSRQLSLIQGY
jgi:YfiH family protein